MNRKLTDWRDITLQYDNFETEAKEIVSAMIESDHLGRDRERFKMVRDNLTKLVKTAFFAGRQAFIDEVNEKDDAPTSLDLAFCRCGSVHCSDVYFSNFGKFVQGSGFTFTEAMTLKVAYAMFVGQRSYQIDDEIGFSVGWDMAAPGREGTAKVILRRNDTDGTVEVIDAEFTEVEQEAPHGWVFYGPDGNWHWSSNPDYHESVEDLRPATAIEAGLATSRIGDDMDRRVEVQEDADRWRAFVSSARFKMIGSANIVHENYPDGPISIKEDIHPDDWIHFGLEVWDRHPVPDDAQGRHGRKLLMTYVDHMVERRREESDNGSQ